MGLYAYPQSYSGGAGHDGPSILEMYTARAGGLSLTANHASGDIRFYTGGTTLRGTMLDTGVFDWVGQVKSASLEVTGAAVDMAALAVQAGVTVTSAAGRISVASSSRRFKENERPWTGDPYAITHLVPTLFDYRLPSTQKDRLGLIAEDALTVLPEAIVYDEKGQPAGFDHGALFAATVAAVTQLRVEMLEAKREIANLRERIH